MTRTTRWLVAALLAIGLAAGAMAWLLPRLLPETGPGAAALRIGGPFLLASARGGMIDSRHLAGTPYAVFFGFTHCPEVCPTTLYELSSSLAGLGDKAKDFRVFFITVDPARDTLAAMKDYVANFDPRIEALVPSEAELQRLATDFRVFYQKVPTSDGSYTMDHTATVFLFDRTGQLAGTLAYDEAAENRAAKLKRLIGD